MEYYPTGNHPVEPTMEPEMSSSGKKESNAGTYAQAATQTAASVAAVTNDVLKQRAIAKEQEERNKAYQRKSTFARDVNTANLRESAQQRALRMILRSQPRAY